MATNIYKCRETVWYVPGKPTHCWGWSVCTSGDERSLALLKNKATLNVLVNAVLAALVKKGIEATRASGLPGEIEALFVMAQIDGDRDDMDWFHEVLTGMAPERTVLWEFLMELVGYPKIRNIVNE